MNAKRVAIMEREGIVALDLAEMMHENGFSEVAIFKTFSSLMEHLSENKVDVVLLDSTEDIPVTKINLITQVFKVKVICLTDLPDETRNIIQQCAILKKPYQKMELVKILRESQA